MSKAKKIKEWHPKGKLLPSMLNDDNRKRFKLFRVLSGFKTRRNVATSMPSEFMSPDELSHLNLKRVSSITRLNSPVKTVKRLPKLNIEPEAKNTNAMRTNPSTTNSKSSVFFKSSQGFGIKLQNLSESEQTIPDNELILLYEARCKVTLNGVIRILNQGVQRNKKRVLLGI